MVYLEAIVANAANDHKVIGGVSLRLLVVDLDDKGNQKGLPK